MVDQYIYLGTERAPMSIQKQAQPLHKYHTLYSLA